MNWERALFDASVAMYAISLILFFTDHLIPRRKINRTALVLLFLVFVFQTFYFLGRLVSIGQETVYSRFDVLLLISWFILAVALVVNAFFRIDALLFFVNVFGFTFVSFDTFARQGKIIFPSDQRDLLMIHISLAIASYVAFSFAMIFSVMYLIQERLMRDKRWNRWYLRLPSLNQLDLYTFWSIVAGFPLLVVSTVLGALWEVLVLHRMPLFDPKLIATVLVCTMYGIYLILRTRLGWGMKGLLWYNIICYIAVLINFTVIGDFSKFHHIS